jgi:hypothetical protein
MRYLLDTNIVSDLIRNPQGRVEQHIRAVGEPQVCTSIIVAAELRYGAMKRGSQRLTAQLEAVLGALDVLPLRRQPTPPTACSAPASSRRVSRSAATTCSSRLKSCHSGMPLSPITSASSPGSTAFLARIGSANPARGSGLAKPPSRSPMWRSRPRARHIGRVGPTALR